MMASEGGHTEIVKMLLEKEGVDINAIGVYLFLSSLISIILDFKLTFGISSNYLKQHL